MQENKCSGSELSELLDFMENTENRYLVESWIRESYASAHNFLPEEADPDLQQRLRSRMQHILKERHPGKNGVLLFLRAHAGKAAAAVLLIITTAVYFLMTPQRPEKSESPAKLASLTTLPELITLTLEDGRKIALDSLENGLIAHQQAAGVFLRGGQLSYQPGERGLAGYNTITVPKGRQFQLVLSDGTHVWLNATSSLKYPTSFQGSERVVEVEGEAYFEVKKRTGPDGGRALPFRVRTGKETEIDVLGTHFNVNAYPEEPYVATTLIEGSVRVRDGAGQRLLRPGEQSLYNRLSQVPEQKKVNTDQVIAWKDGVFDLNGKALKEIMSELSRWYDIEVVYQEGIPDIEFGGKMGRDVSLEKVLGFLKKSGLHFSMEEEGRRIIITRR